MDTAKEILQVLTTYGDTMREKFSVRRIGLFGSRLRDQARPESDIDLLVELDEPTFDHYMDLKFFLEDLLKSQVDLVLADSVKPRLRPYIQREVVYAQGLPPLSG